MAGGGEGFLVSGDRGGVLAAQGAGGGVRAALEGHQAGAVALWLQPLRNLAAVCREELDGQPSDDARWDRLCELNVAAQVEAVAASEVVQAAWERGAELAVHGWIYDLEDGLLRALEVTVGGAPADG